MNNDIDKNQILMKEIINCILPDGKQTFAFLNIYENDITLYKKSGFIIAYPILLGKFILSTIEKYKKKKLIGRFTRKEIAFVEKKKFRLNNNVFYVCLINGSNYQFIFDSPKEALVKLKSIWPEVEFRNFY